MKTNYYILTAVVVSCCVSVGCLQAELKQNNTTSSTSDSAHVMKSTEVLVPESREAVDVQIGGDEQVTIMVRKSEDNEILFRGHISPGKPAIIQAKERITILADNIEYISVIVNGNVLRSDRVGLAKLELDPFEATLKKAKYPPLPKSEKRAEKASKELPEDRDIKSLQGIHHYNFDAMSKALIARLKFERGESISMIASRYGLTLQEFWMLNPDLKEKATRLNTGDEYIIPVDLFVFYSVLEELSANRVSLPYSEIRKVEGLMKALLDGGHLNEDDLVGDAENMTLATMIQSLLINGLVSYDKHFSILSRLSALKDDEGARVNKFEANAAGSQAQPNASEGSVVNGKQPKPPTPNQLILMDGAEEALRASDFSEAISLYWQTIAEDRTVGAAWFALSKAYVFDKQWKPAEAAILEAMRLDGDISEYQTLYKQILNKEQIQALPARVTQGSAEKPSDLDVPEFLRAKYPGLIELILNTASMDTEEKQEWIAMLLEALEIDVVDLSELESD